MFWSVFIMVLVLPGFYVVIKEYEGRLIGYSKLMSLIFFIIFPTGIIGLTLKYNSSYNAIIAETFKPSFGERNETPTNFYHDNFKCCGWNDYKDFITNNARIPDSCCKSLSDCDISNVNENIINNSTFYEPFINTNGCKDDLVTAIVELNEATFGILVGLSIIILISIALSILLARKIKSGHRYG